MSSSQMPWEALALALIDAEPAVGVVLIDAAGRIVRGNRLGLDLAPAFELSHRHALPTDTALAQAIAQAARDPATRWLRGIAGPAGAADIVVVRGREADERAVIVQLRPGGVQALAQFGHGEPGRFDRWGSSSDGLFEWRIDSGAVRFFPGWQRLVDDQPTMVDNYEGWLARIVPDDRPLVLDAIKAHLDGRTPTLKFEYRLDHAEGGRRWMRSIAAVAERDAAGRPLRLVGYGVDITAQRALEQALSEYTVLLRESQRMAQLGSWTYDVDSGRVTWSDALFRIAGLEPGTALDFASHARVFTAESWARLQRQVETTIATGASYEIELEMLRPDGEIRHVRAHGEALRDRAGRVVRLFGVAQDVTAQVERERVLREQSALLARMSAIARIGGWSYDVARARLTWTDETYAIHELEPGTPVDVATAIAFYTGESRQRIEAAFRRALAEGVGFDLELTLRTAKGRDLWVRSQGQVEREGGRVLRVFGTFQDVSDRHLAQRRLDAALESLKAANTELRQFAFVASHDLQEPLRKVRTFGALLAERHRDALGPAGRDYLDRMIGAAERMSALVDDLLQLSRIDSAARERARVDLGAVASEVVADFDVELAACGGQIEIGPLPTIEADRTQMQQLLQNLIGNALKYRAPGRAPRVRIEALSGPGGTAALLDGPQCRIVVSDNGIGFDNRYAQQIFEPFRRLHDRSTYAGTGMGLSIVRRIVERHGGRIEAEGRPGEGASFRIDLPVSAPPERDSSRELG